MTLQFESSSSGSYNAGSITNATFARNGDNLILTLDEDNEITINNAFDSNADTGPQGSNLAYTINIQYGSEGSYQALEDMAALWSVWSALT